MVDKIRLAYLNQNLDYMEKAKKDFYYTNSNCANDRDGWWSINAAMETHIDKLKKVIADMSICSKCGHKLEK